MPISEEKKAYNRAYYLSHSDKIKSQAKKWSEANPEKRRKISSGWRNKNREKERARGRKFHSEHAEDINARHRNSYKENRNRILARQRKNAGKTRERNRSKYKNDPNFKIRLNLRNRLNQALQAQTARRTSSAVRDLGCTISEFRAYLEKLFKPGMTWENHGRTGWHIDHIRPLASFDLTNPEQQRRACHYTNLQPLWAPENLSKSCKFDIRIGRSTG